MSFSDLLEKLASGETLNPSEVQSLSRSAKDIEIILPTLSGLIDQNGDFIDILPMGVIHSDILSLDASSVTYQIPSNYKHLLIIGSGRTTAIAGDPQGHSLNFTFNGDTDTNYQWSEVFGSANGAGGQSFNSQSNIPFGLFDSDDCPDGAASSFFAVIPHYTGSLWKMVISMIAAQLEPSPDLTETVMVSGFWKSTDPISSITVTPNTDFTGDLKTGSLISIYGIK